MRWLVLLLLIPVAAADDVRLVAPDSLSFERGSVMVGHVEEALGLSNPRIVDPVELILAGGTLQACRLSGNQGLVDQLSELPNAPCEDQVVYQEPRVTFSLGARIVLAGQYAVSAPPAIMASIAGDGVAAALVSGGRMDVLGVDYRFAAIDETAQVIVRTDSERREFNGTEWGFTYSESTTRWIAPGIIGQSTLDQIHLREAEHKGIEALPDPFVLLDLQAAQYGDDAKEPRATLARTVREFGRIPDIINGALYGHLEGNVGPVRLKPADVSLVRFSELLLTFDGATWRGQGDLRLAVTGEGISTGGDIAQPRFLLTSLLWIGAIAVSLVRRHPVGPKRPRRMANVTMGTLLFLWVDLFVLRRYAGNSAILSMFNDYSAGAVLNLFTIGGIFAAMTYLLYLVPLRRIGRKLAAKRWQAWTADGVAWLFTAILLTVFPARLLALAYTVVRF